MKIMWWVVQLRLNAESRRLEPIPVVLGGWLTLTDDLLVRVEFGGFGRLVGHGRW